MSVIGIKSNFISDLTEECLTAETEYLRGHHRSGGELVPSKLLLIQDHFSRELPVLLHQIGTGRVEKDPSFIKETE